MQNFELPSGVTLGVEVSPFVDALALQKAILKSFKGSGFEKIGDIDLDPANPMDSLKKNAPDVLSGLIDRVLSVAVSDDVEAALHRCFKGVVYGDQRLTVPLFDDPAVSEKLRQDYYMICLRVMEVNCKPFLLQLFSRFKQNGLPNPKSAPAS